MRLVVKFTAMGLLLGVVAACGGATDASVSSPGLGVGSLPAGSAASSTSLAPATSGVPVSVDPSTTPVAAATTMPPAPCDGTDGVLTTVSGRHVLVRAGGVAPQSPVVLILHGFTGTPTGIEKFAEFTSLAAAASVVVAYPEGNPVPDYEGFGWTTGSGIFSTEGTDDVQALSEMLDVVLATGCGDPTRVVLVGESNGAAMGLVAACDARVRDRIQTLVMVIPAVDDGVLARCGDGVRAVPLSVVAGRLDRTAPYEGGRATLLPQEDWFAQVASDVNGCAVGAVERQSFDAHVTLLTPTGCAECTEFFSVDDGTHTWPGSSRGTGGLRPGTFDLSKRLLDLALAGGQGCL